MKKKNWRILWAVLVVGVGIYVYVHFWGSSNGKNAKEVAPVPVLLDKAKVQDVPVLLNVVGRAEAYESVTIKARVDGQVTSVVFKEGQPVNQGDVLIRLDTTDFDLRLRQAEANVEKDQAQLVKAKADTVRYVALFDRHFVSEEKVNEIRTTEAAAVATLNADKAEADLARSQLSYAVIRAPFSGIVGAKLIFPGGSLKANDTTLATINRVDPLYVTFSVSERYLPKIRAAMSAKSASCKGDGCLKVAVGLPGEKQKRFEATVRFIDNAVDATTGTIQIKAVLNNKNGALTPGQYLDLSLNLETLHDAVVVPNEAVQQGANGSFIFVVDTEGAAEVRQVEIASSDGRVTAISKGIRIGETVVVDGQLRLAPGVKVVEKNKSPQSPPDGAAAPKDKK